MSKKTLVIVESPTKAKTISKFLGTNFRVISSLGHVRDLPKSEMGVAIDDGSFLPEYIISPTKKKTVSELKKLANDVDEVLFATDEDREGEAISWHLAHVLNIKEKSVKRLVFHEITEEAIMEAFEKTRPLNMGLVNAQQARRVLDRLVGYELSPLLWRKVRFGLSAGRVQSVAVHLIVAREHERTRFKKAVYFDLEADFENKKTERFTAKLKSFAGKFIPTGKDFDENSGTLKQPEKFLLLNETAAEELCKKIKNIDFVVGEVKKSEHKKSPPPPFTTSTLQQTANRRFGFSAKETMRIAQSLYENGYITYMRTDSPFLSAQAVSAARQIASALGPKFVADKPRQYTAGKAGRVEEAHEAIRPAGAKFKSPEEVAREVNPAEAKLFDLIWRRTVASQMSVALFERQSAEIIGGEAIFGVSGERLIFPGFLKILKFSDTDEVILPELNATEAVKIHELKANHHETEPPARYTEATLVKALESAGVGRPSTYATIIDTILERDYVRKAGQALFPTFTALIVDTYLTANFTSLVDTGFTAKMEEELDQIAAGEREWQPYLKSFYHGDEDHPPFHETIEKAKEAKGYPEFVIGEHPETREPIIIKSGKFGPYLETKDKQGELNRGSLPEHLAPADLELEEAIKILVAAATPDKPVGQDPRTGQEVFYKSGRFGPYLEVAGLDGKKGRSIALTYGPKRQPIFMGLDPNNPTPDNINQALLLPRLLGEYEGEKVEVSVGRFGPYVKHGKEFRSLKKEHSLLGITLEEAIELIKTPKTRGRNSAKILREIGADPESGKPVQILDGRYGAYISNGTRVFATVPKDLEIEKITLEEAVQLLKEKKGKKRAPSKKRKGVKK